MDTLASDGIAAVIMTRGLCCISRFLKCSVDALMTLLKVEFSVWPTFVSSVFCEKYFSYSKMVVGRISIELFTLRLWLVIDEFVGGDVASMCIDAFVRPK